MRSRCDAIDRLYLRPRLAHIHVCKHVLLTSCSERADVLDKLSAKLVEVGEKLAAAEAAGKTKQVTLPRRAALGRLSFPCTP